LLGVHKYVISYSQDDETGELNTTSDTERFIPCIQEVILHTNMSINIVLFHKNHLRVLRLKHIVWSGNMSICTQWLLLCSTALHNVLEIPFFRVHINFDNCWPKWYKNQKQ